MTQTDLNMSNYEDLRHRLTTIALEWESAYVIAPSITSALSELDAARLTGLKIDIHSEEQITTSKIVGFDLEPTYSDLMQGKTTVSKGYDFKFKGHRFQVKANRPSGKSGSFVTKAPQPKNLEWDYLIYILYDKNYALQEAWMWEVKDYEAKLHDKKRLTPNDYRNGLKINIDVMTIFLTFRMEDDNNSTSKLSQSTLNDYTQEELNIFQSNLHSAINSDVGHLIRKFQTELPDIESLFIGKENLKFFKVDGMYGGYNIWLDKSQPKLTLYAYGFSRIHEGIERLFRVDIDGFKLIKVGDKLHLP